jgi:predicted kinase
MKLEKFNPHELISWFQLNHPAHVNEMMNSTHHYSVDRLNPYHLEGDIWTHTCMVVNVANLMKYPDVVVASSLLHDLGKPYVREINHDTERVYFKNHEGVSFWKSIGVVKQLTDDAKKRETILKLVALHSVIFDNHRDGKFSKDFFKKFRGDEEFLELVKMQVISDSMGRFCYDLEDVREKFDRIFNDDFYTELVETFNTPVVKKHDNTLTILIGLPRSGKSTWITKNVTDEVVISRDDALVKYAKELYNVKTYSEAFKALNDNDQKAVDAIIGTVFQKAVKEGKDIVIDMTNMSKKSRRKWLAQYGGNKKAIIFATDMDEIARRNEHDRKTIGKYIPPFVIDNMAKNFVYPQYDEFDTIEVIIT